MLNELISKELNSIKSDLIQKEKNSLEVLDKLKIFKKHSE